MRSLKVDLFTIVIIHDMSVGLVCMNLMKTTGINNG